MFEIQLSQVSKRFGREWIFRDVNLRIVSGTFSALIGANGSGKSTLLQILAGFVSPAQGQRTYLLDGQNLAPESVFHYVSICAPYLELIEELTLREFLDFHFTFKKSRIPIDEQIRLLGLWESRNKILMHFSSGMKQRVKLGQAIFADTPALFLDEPCSNLDENGIALYHQLIQTHTSNRLVVVASNDPTEYSFCQQTTSLSDLKSEKKTASHE